ncbi:MAG: hypothetical protein Ct9H90mP25_2260 [Gammaproteobacteria bacterium]|nr:MAG: hypothetical protein Ct9H90mP25_2260 [Gammaproteobacteria bacterium]
MKIIILRALVGISGVSVLLILVSHQLSSVRHSPRAIGDASYKASTWQGGALPNARLRRGHVWRKHRDPRHRRGGPHCR